MGIRLLLVDSEVLFRQGLKALLQTDPGLEIVGEAATGREAIEKATALEPDLVVMEIRLPDGHSIRALRTIRARCPRTQVLILTSRADLRDFRRAANAGAIGYAVKDTDSATLAEAIRSAHAGKKTLSPSMLEYLIEQHFSGALCALKTRLGAIYRTRGLPPTARRRLKLAVYVLAFGAGIVIGAPVFRHGRPPAPRAVTQVVTASLRERIEPHPIILQPAVNAVPPFALPPASSSNKKARAVAAPSPPVSRKPPQQTARVRQSASNISSKDTNQPLDFRRYGERAKRQNLLEVTASGPVAGGTREQPEAPVRLSPPAQSSPATAQPRARVAPRAQGARPAEPAPAAAVHAPPGIPVWIIFAQSVGAAKLGATVADLTGLFGKPTNTVRLADGSVTHWWLDAAKQEGFGARVAGNGRVDRLSLANDPRYMTDAGLHVGSTELEVRTALGAPTEVDLDAGSHAAILRYDQLGVWFEIPIDPKTARYATVAQIDVVARSTRARVASPPHVREKQSGIRN